MPKPRCIYCNRKTDYGSNICLRCYAEDVALEKLTGGGDTTGEDD